MTKEISKEINEIKNFVQSYYLTEDKINYLVSDIEDNNWEDSWQFLDKTEQVVQELLRHITRAKILVGNKFKESTTDYNQRTNTSKIPYIVDGPVALPHETAVIGDFDGPCPYPWQVVRR